MNQRIQLLIGLVGAGLAALTQAGGFSPAANYSLGFDGDATTASSVLGGNAVKFKGNFPQTGSSTDFETVRGMVGNRAMVVSDLVNPCGPVDLTGAGSWSILAVARGGQDANSVFWEFGDASWNSGSTGFALVRSGNGTVDLVRWMNGGDNVTLLSAPVADDNTRFHAYLVTYDAAAAGTEESPYFTLYVDGQLMATWTANVTVKRTGFQIGSVYGGNKEASLELGKGMAMDEFGVWRQTLTAADAVALAAYFPVWPADGTVHMVTMNSSASFSQLDWNPAWGADDPAKVGAITAAGPVVLTVDGTPVVGNLLIESDGDFGLSVADGGSLERVASVDFSDVAGKVVLDGAAFAQVGRFGFSTASVVRVEETLPVSLPVDGTGRCGFLCEGHQTLEIAAPVTFPWTEDRHQLSFGTSGGHQNIVLDEGAELTGDVLRFGTQRGASADVLQRGGTIVLSSPDLGDVQSCAMILGHWLDSAYTKYDLTGGLLDVSAGEIRLGYDSAAQMTVGGGETQAVLKAKQIFATSRQGTTSTLTLKPNGRLEIGSGGILMSSSLATMELQGGVVQAAATTRFDVETGVAVTGEVTLDVPEGIVLSIPVLSGAGTLVKTGAGRLVYDSAFAGELVVREGEAVTFCESPWLDYTFSLDTLAQRQPTDPANPYYLNIQNAGTAGSDATLKYDGDYDCMSSYNAETGLLLARAAPFRYMEGDLAWPSRFSIAVCASVPDIENGCLVGFGSSWTGSRTYLALTRGASSDEIKLVSGTGWAPFVTLATMGATAATRAKHLVVITYDRFKYQFYCDGVKVGEYAVHNSELGTGFQVGSIHGGTSYLGEDTGLRHAREAPNPDACEIRAIRVYDGVLRPSEIARLTEEFPYVPESGRSVRSFSGTASWRETDRSWRVERGGAASAEFLPAEGSSVELTLSEAGELQVNESGAYDGLRIDGAPLTVRGSARAVFSGAVMIRADVTLCGTEEGMPLDLGLSPVAIAEDASLTIDLSSVDVNALRDHYSYKVTGYADAGLVDDGKLALHMASDLELDSKHVANLTYGADGCWYVELGLVRAPADVAYVSGVTWGDGSAADEIVVRDADGQNLLLPGDTIVFGNGTDVDVVMAPGALTANRARVEAGTNLRVRSAQADAPVLDGVEVTVRGSLCLNAMEGGIVRVGSPTLMMDGGTLAFDADAEIVGRPTLAMHAPANVGDRVGTVAPGCTVKGLLKIEVVVDGASARRGVVQKGEALLLCPLGSVIILR